MAYLSRTSYIGDGNTTTFTYPFGYLNKSHVKVYVDSILATDYTWDTDSIIRFTTAPASGAEILLKRETPNNKRLVDFQNGSLTDSETFDLDSNQNFYLNQEAWDNSSGDNVTTALTYANLASQKADEAGASAHEAAVSASSAATSATNAATSATNAAASAESAETFANNAAEAVANVPAVKGIIYMNYYINENNELIITSEALNTLCAEKKINTLFFPKGTYILTETLYVPSGCSLLGEQSGKFNDSFAYSTSTIIKPNSNITGALISGPSFDTTIKNIMFDCSEASGITTIIDSSNFAVIDSCYFKGDTLSLNGIQSGSKVIQCRFEGNPQYYIKNMSGNIAECSFIGNGKIDNLASGNTISDCYFNGNPDAYIEAANGSLFRCTFIGTGSLTANAGGGPNTEQFVDCSITGNPTNGYFIQQVSPNKTFRNCTFSGNGKISSSTIVNGLFIDCTFNGNPSGGNFLNGLVSSQIKHCTFSGSPSSGYFVYSYHNTIIEDCAFNGSPSEGMVYLGGQNSRFEYSYLTGGTGSKPFIVLAGATIKIHEIDIQSTISNAIGIAGAMAQNSELSRCYIHGCTVSISWDSFQNSRMVDNELSGTVTIAQAMADTASASEAKLFRNIFESTVTITAGYYTSKGNQGFNDN